MTRRSLRLLHTIDVPALRRMEKELTRCINNISSIQTDNATVQREFDLATTVLHLRIKKVEKALSRAMEGDDNE